MGILLGANIGTNYKGILNLNTLNGNLSATLQAVTDGDGNASPLNLATGSIQFGSTTGLFWDNANNKLSIGTNNAGSAQLKVVGRSEFGPLIIGFQTESRIVNGFGSGSLNIVSIGVAIGAVSENLTPLARLHVKGNGTNPIALFQGSGTIGNLVCFGGLTNAFPAIKINGAGIDFRLADDSGFCDINVAAITASATSNISTARMSNINDSTNSVTAINIASTSGKVSFGGLIRAANLPSARPSIVGDLYKATAADILANGDLVVGIRQ
jgi:hypothetical protein